MKRFSKWSGFTNHSQARSKNEAIPEQKVEAPVDPKTAIPALDEAITQTSKRIIDLTCTQKKNNEIARDVNKPRPMRAHALRISKLYEQQIANQYGTLTNMKKQLLGLKTAVQQKDVLGAMYQARECFETLQQQIKANLAIYDDPIYKKLASLLFQTGTVLAKSETSQKTSAAGRFLLASALDPSAGNIVTESIKHAEERLDKTPGKSDKYKTADVDPAKNLLECKQLLEQAQKPDQGEKHKTPQAKRQKRKYGTPRSPRTISENAQEILKRYFSLKGGQYLEVLYAFAKSHHTEVVYLDGKFLSRKSFCDFAVDWIVGKHPEIANEAKHVRWQIGKKLDRIAEKKEDIISKIIKCNDAHEKCVCASFRELKAADSSKPSGHFMFSNISTDETVERPEKRRKIDNTNRAMSSSSSSQSSSSSSSNKRSGDESVSFLEFSAKSIANWWRK